MKILRDYDLTKLNTFGVQAKAKFFIEIESEADLLELFGSQEFKENDKFFLGGGSNVLFTRDFDGIVIFNKLKGIEIVKEDDENVWIKSMSGEIWHDLVSFAVSRGLWGIENLSLIPGTVGASPVQNIGAYGVELKDSLESLEAFEIKTGERKSFLNTECTFDYRDSVFKSKLRGEYFISSITVKLSKSAKPNLSYKILSEHIKINNITTDHPKNISDAVSAIRQSKLPDPKVLGNAGSFFKNVFVENSKLEKLKTEYPEIPSFEEEGNIKIPAGWLIEKCGWKGKKVGNVGMHEKQALVLINYGGASGNEIKDLANQVIASIFDKFGLRLEPEVTII